MTGAGTDESRWQGGTVPVQRPRRRYVLHSAKAPLRLARRAYWSTTSSNRTLPDVLLIGAQKAGTTSLFGYLADHPGVLPALVKEVHYFDLNATRGDRWYRAHFPTDAERSRASESVGRPARVLEASPYYLFHPQVPARVREQLPEAKLIVVLRHPVDRAISHHNHSVEQGFERLPFAEAIELEEERLRGEVERLRADPAYRSFSHQHHSYLARGRYAEQLDAWLEHFPREQILILESRRLRDDPESGYAAVCDFVGLPRHALPRYEAVGRRRYPAIDGALRAELEDRFRPHNERLWELIGEDFGW